MGYNGQQYEEKTCQNFSKRYIHSTYQEGMEYDIYIDIENPKRFRVVQKFDFICLVLLVIGIFFFLGGFIPMKELFGMIWKVNMQGLRWSHILKVDFRYVVYFLNKM